MEKRYIGIDLHRNGFTSCLRLENGRSYLSAAGRSGLSARGMNLPKEALSSEKQPNEILALPLDALLQVELHILVEQIRSLNKSIGELEKPLRRKPPNWRATKA